MIESASIDWLARKWGLPAGAFASVHGLLQAENEGGTAWELREPVEDWGEAAGPENGDSPLVLIEDGARIFLQSRRLFLAESEIAGRLTALAAKVSRPGSSEKDLMSLFPEARAGDLQLEAARLATTWSLTIITGGPGTGKTYVLARILALLADEDLPAGSIRLAAPTGKAADRMKRAVAQSIEGLPDAVRSKAELLTRIANSSATIHSLLGYNPDKGRCRFDRNHPLPCRALILDECSMIDVHLWQALLEALPADARLVLLGDPNQLESVGQGNVFFDLAQAAGPVGSPLHASHVHLTGTRRFHESPGIVALAQALENSDPEAAEKLLANPDGTPSPKGVAWIELPGGVMTCADFPASVLEALELVATAASPQEALDALSRICVLTAQREFFVGSKAMSFAIENHFRLRDDVRNHPVIISRNDPDTGLRNGDVGVIHQFDTGQRRAIFPSGDQTLREFPVSKLPEHAPAWAITIHRSQGSEYDNVLVVLPRKESPLATRELLYTAVTRARSMVYVAGDLETVKNAVVTSSARCTMLGRLLA